MPDTTGGGHGKFTSQNPSYETLNSRWSKSHRDYRYSNYMMAISYKASMGEIGLPIAGPNGTPVAKVKTHAACMDVSVVWSAVRIGAQPEVPSPFTPDGSNYTLKSFEFCGDGPSLESDGMTYRFVVGGLYVYILSLPIYPDDGYRLAAMPFQAYPASTMVFSAENFRRTIFAFDQ